MTADNPKAAALRARMDVRRPALAMAAHNPLSARLAAAGWPLAGIGDKSRDDAANGEAAS